MNVFPETYCAVAAVAAAMGRRLAIHCVHDQGGLPEAVAPHDIVDIDLEEVLGLKSTKGAAIYYTPQTVSRVMPRWLEVLGLNKHERIGTTKYTGVRVPMSVVEKELGWVPFPPGPGEESACGCKNDGQVLTCCEKHQPHPLVEPEHPNAEPEPTPMKKTAPYRPPFASRLVPAPVALPRAGLTGMMGPTARPEARIDKLGYVRRQFQIDPTRSTSIGLVIIAKNEAAVLPRAIKSVVGLVDYVTVVLDQKNNDASMAVLSPQVGNCVVVTAPTPFAGLSQARNEAVDLAVARWPDMGYVLMLDADDVIETRRAVRDRPRC